MKRPVAVRRASPLFALPSAPGEFIEDAAERLGYPVALKIVSPEVAAGYRVQYGEFQWLFYRALESIAPRTLLGQHLNFEFYAARFLPDGGTEDLLALEQG